MITIAQQAAICGPLPADAVEQQHDRPRVRPRKVHGLIEVYFVGDELFTSWTDANKAVYGEGWTGDVKSPPQFSPLPTPQEIAAACAAIQDEWSDVERLRRWCRPGVPDCRGARKKAGAQ